MIAVSIILIAVAGILCAMAIAGAASITDRQDEARERRRQIKDAVEHRYWYMRHGDRWWPGKEN
jgi:type II secretory pathway pseudopilin PulG